MCKNGAFDAKIVNTRLTKICIAIFAPDERLPSSATLLLLLDQDFPKEDFFSHLGQSLPGDLNFVVEWQQQYYLVSSCRPPWLLTYDKVAYNTTKFKTLSREELLLNSPQSSAKAHPYCREASFDSLHSVFWSTNALHI